MLVLFAAYSHATHARPKIYSYKLLPDSKYHDLEKYGHEFASPGCFYSLDYLFPQLLKESLHATSNASEADFFYVSNV